MQILIDISESWRPGVAAARALHNATAAEPIASDEAYLQWVLSRAVESYQPLAVPTPPPPPPPPGMIDGIPQEVTRRQARSALALSGKLSTVQGCIDAIPDAAQRQLLQIEWDDSQTFQRQRPSLIALATSPAPYGLGMTLVELDAMFVQAAAL